MPNPLALHRPLLPEERPQDHPRQDGTGLTFTKLEHGGEEPDNMPQAILLTDAEGRSCLYVLYRVNGQIVSAKALTD
jgi:hypothetical protein